METLVFLALIVLPACVGLICWEMGARESDEDIEALEHSLDLMHEALFEETVRRQRAESKEKGAREAADYWRNHYYRLRHETVA